MIALVLNTGVDKCLYDPVNTQPNPFKEKYKFWSSLMYLIYFQPYRNN
jgi:hypothetical protein